jgi:hypothetical protein
MRVELTYFCVHTPKHIFLMNYPISGILRQSWAAVLSNTRRIRLTSCGDLCGIVDICLPSFHCYRFTNPILDACHAWGGCGWHKHIPQHSNHTINVMRSKRPMCPNGPLPSPKPISLTHLVACTIYPIMHASSGFLLSRFPNTSPVHAVWRSMLHSHTRKPNLAHWNRHSRLQTPSNMFKINK